VRSINGNVMLIQQFLLASGLKQVIHLSAGQCLAHRVLFA